VDASYCKKIKKSDGLVEFDDAFKIFNKFRAFIVWPGIFLKSGLKLKAIELVEKIVRHEPGQILAIEKEGVVVGCAKGRVKITRVQPPSKKEMDALSYIRGRRLGVGDTFI
jgi:methionyl-tRNA formyltransferase